MVGQARADLQRCRRRCPPRPVAPNGFIHVPPRHGDRRNLRRPAAKAYKHPLQRHLERGKSSSWLVPYALRPGPAHPDSSCSTPHTWDEPPQALSGRAVLRPPRATRPWPNPCGLVLGASDHRRHRVWLPSKQAQEGGTLGKAEPVTLNLAGESCRFAEVLDQARGIRRGDRDGRDQESRVGRIATVTFIAENLNCAAGLLSQ